MATVAQPNAPSQSEPQLDQLCINTIRTLTVDAVQKAESGHPGAVMALAPLAYVLWTRHLRHNPADPGWADRDRFVLSVGHASMLVYSLLHLTGYDVTIEDIKAFRQWGSKTPGHPEYGHTPGVETTTGPLGQGVGNAVGFAVAEAHMAAVFNRPGHAVMDHHTYFFCSDGDLMEGVSHEACSFAGHLKLGKLIGFYDDNKVTIDGSTDLTLSDDAGRRFEAYGWHVQHLDDVNDLAAVERAIEAAKAVADRPSMVVCRTIIGYGNPKRQGTSKAHSDAIGEAEIALTKETLGWPSREPFFIPESALDEWRKAVPRGAALQAEWQRRFDAYKAAFPTEGAEFERRWRRELPEGWEAALPSFTAESGAVASRAASGVVINAVAAVLPELVGGSADLAPSNNTLIKGAGDFSAANYAARNFHYGVREHGMGAVMNGMALHGGIIPYGGTFLIFSDYMRPAIRLAALMERHVIYVFTHDSIALGEDGPTHQPVEQLATLRAIPGLTVLRPADAGETVEAWKAALKHTHGPVALLLTRQKLGFVDRTRYAAAAGVQRGAYVMTEASGRPDVVLLASGSEVGLVLEAQRQLEQGGVQARVVSMPSMELFAAQDAAYRREVLPPGVPRVSIEAAHPMSWYRWVGEDGVAIGVERFGASAPYERVFKELGLTAEKVVEAARTLLKKS
ncbi:MAG: Transketolase [uncultured Gemmatimonadaceae bacterium]|uniref:Transketolase n=1 Tax=uncultured Gemmatimonadaceae bacterium TaxID=246130 RepID=A0A6J4L4G7_9BACT|nr:MAG: Transketolase [uncultured Gemmatimonadaceae bacterium]